MAEPVKPGDIVRWDDGERVVVDVSGDGMAVLRPRDDELGSLVATQADALTAVGHI